MAASIDPHVLPPSRAYGRVRLTTLSGARCVLKRLPPGRTPDAAARHEALLAALTSARHGALAPVAAGGVAVEDGRPVRWIAARWIEGRCARETVEAGGLPWRAALGVLATLARGLDRLHAAGVIHRDVAPGNVILTGSGEAVLIDYGHACLASAGLPASAGVVGTPGYVAPEEVVAGPGAVTFAVDVYGLGAVGYALLTGVPPARGEDVLDALSRAAQPPPRPSELGVEVPGPLEAALQSALAPDPKDRAAAGALAQALESAARELAVGDHGVGDPA